jgi:hypothetical protein
MSRYEDFPLPEDLWLVRGSMGGVIQGIDSHNEHATLVMMRLQSVENGGDRTDDRIYLLDLENCAQLMAGLQTVTGTAWSRSVVLDAVADALGISVEDKLRALDRAAELDKLRRKQDGES